MLHDSICLILLLTVMQESPAQIASIENLTRATDTVFVGSEPRSAEAFAHLKSLGITTIISVDGATPDVDGARQHGLRYIHIPFGYDGIPHSAAMKLFRTAREVQSPLYVHCHHGRHRGPAAAAIICLSSGSLNHAQAVELMTKAGTSKDYPGLWRDVKGFDSPGSDVELPELAEAEAVDSTAAAMVKLDRSFESLKHCESAGWKVPTDHPDLDPVPLAVLVREALHETARHSSSEHDVQFHDWLQSSESIAGDLVTAIRAGDAVAASEKLKAVEQSCTRCHASYRNH